MTGEPGGSLCTGRVGRENVVSLHSTRFRLKRLTNASEFMQANRPAFQSEDLVFYQIYLEIFKTVLTKLKILLEFLVRFL